MDSISYELSAAGKAYRRKCGERRDSGAKWDGRPFDALIFEGGGTKGTVYGGVTKRLDDAGLLDGIRYFAGTSAGAQTAALCAVGYSGDELVEAMANAPWGRLLDKSRFFGCCGCFGNVARLRRDFGICKGEVLKDYMDNLVARKVGHKGYTLKNLHDEKGVVLRLGACNVTTRRFELLDYLSHPNMPVATAARASSSVPVVFVPVQYRTKAGLDMLYVDGGLEGNIPTKAFLGKRALAFNLMSNGDWAKDGGKIIRPTTFLSYMTTLTDMVINSAQSTGGYNDDEDPTVLLRQQGVHVIKVDCMDHRMLETKMQPEDVKRMVASGWDAMDDYLSDLSGPADSCAPTACLAVAPIPNGDATPHKPAWPSDGSEEDQDELCKRVASALLTTVGGGEAIAAAWPDKDLPRARAVLEAALAELKHREQELHFQRGASSIEKLNGLCSQLGSKLDRLEARTKALLR